MKLFELSRRTLQPVDVKAVPFKEWQENQEGTAISLAQDVSLDDVRPFLGQLTLIVLEFPVFRDGRAFTQARSLREYEHYEGEIRARGHVIPDQAIHLQRCGFDSVELSDEARVEEWTAQLNRYQFYYQKVAGQS